MKTNTLIWSIEVKRNMIFLKSDWLMIYIIYEILTWLKYSIPYLIVSCYKYFLSSYNMSGLNVGKVELKTYHTENGKKRRPKIDTPEI